MRISKTERPDAFETWFKKKREAYRNGRPVWVCLGRIRVLTEGNGQFG